MDRSALGFVSHLLEWPAVACCLEVVAPAAAEQTVSPQLRCKAHQLCCEAHQLREDGLSFPRGPRTSMCRWMPPTAAALPFCCCIVIALFAPVLCIFLVFASGHAVGNVAPWLQWLQTVCGYSFSPRCQTRHLQGQLNPSLQIPQYCYAANVCLFVKKITGAPNDVMQRGVASLGV